MSFFPIAELLDGVRGREHLARAIALYLECKKSSISSLYFGALTLILVFTKIPHADKPQIEELRYFLEFQVPRLWAPNQERFPGQPRKEPVCPSLQFSMMGQKLYVSQEQVSISIDR